MDKLKQFLVIKFLYAYTNLRDSIKIYAWRKKGSPQPPPHLFKQQLINRYRKKHGLYVFIESGTYLGQMVDAMRYRFKKLKSIELSEELYKKAVEKFKPYRHIKLYLGDSAAILPHIVETLSEPALFWLDGHYSGGITTKGLITTPILDELNTLASAKALNIILIDDARLFTGEDDYPHLEAIHDFVAQKMPSYQMEVKDDIIRISPHKK